MCVVYCRLGTRDSIQVEFGEVNYSFLKLLDRVRGKRAAQWPWPSRRAAGPRAWRPHDETGWTVHGGVALRLKYLSVQELGASIDDPGTEVGAFKIRLAGQSDVREAAVSLVQKRYSRRGYLTAGTLPHSNVCTFAAYDEGRLAGTVSLRLDSKDGLAADELYSAEVEALRREGHKICEFTRLAVDTSRVSQPVLAGLFHTVFLYAQRIHGFNYAVIEVNPRHVAYYRRALGFDAIGAERHNPRVQAPAVLMGVSFQKIGDNLRRFAGRGLGTTKARNLYVHGFSTAEEAGILGRLRTLDAG